MVWVTRAKAKAKPTSKRVKTTIILVQILPQSCAPVLVEKRARGTRTLDPRIVNSLFALAPYKHEGMWVIDDPAVGLSKKPSIAAIDTMIDKVVADIPNAEHGFRAIFSAFPFPGSIFRLEWR